MREELLMQADLQTPREMRACMEDYALAESALEQRSRCGFRVESGISRGFGAFTRRLAELARAGRPAIWISMRRRRWNGPSRRLRDDSW